MARVCSGGHKLKTDKHGACVRCGARANERCRQDRTEADLLAALQIIVANAVVQPDASMKGSTDCYAVPLDDIEMARAAIDKAQGRE